MKLLQIKIKKKYKKKNQTSNDKDNDNIIMNSEESDIYLDIENDNDNLDNINNMKNIDNTKENITNISAVNDTAIQSINNLLGMNKSLFENVDEPNITDMSNVLTPKDEIKSVFMPKIIIGKNDNDDDNGNGNGNGNSRSRYGPYYDPSQWYGPEYDPGSGPDYDPGSGPDYGQNGNNYGYGNSYNNANGNANGNGFGNNQNQSKWNSVFKGSEFDVNGNATNYTDKKRCGQYNKRDSDLLESENGNLLVKEYKDAKTWHPGYTYLPPSNWDVPQKYPPVCSSNPNVFKLTGLIDKGLPLNALELNPGGKQATTEESVHLTNIGSMLPKFSFEEQPFSKPYI